MTPEAVRKALVYLRGIGGYWRADERGKVGEPSGAYPLDLCERLRTGHFGALDGTGVPIQKDSLHNYTTICAFGLAHWGLHQRSRSDEHVDALLRCAAYLERTGQLRDGGLLLREEEPQRGHAGPLSSMVQAEAMSLLCRAHLASGEARYRDLALACLPPFERDVGDDGVCGRIGSDVWFEEETATPLRHILNGMVYAIWGLADLHALTGSARAAELCAAGVRSLVRQVERFDLGWWSLYDVPEIGGRYVASMMYHDLHVCQLALTSKLPQAGALERVAARFASYADSTENRLRAGAALAWDKLTRGRARPGRRAIA